MYMYCIYTEFCLERLDRVMKEGLGFSFETFILLVVINVLKTANLAKVHDFCDNWIISWYITVEVT